MSDASVFSRRGDKVSSHIDTEVERAKHEAAIAALSTSSISSTVSSNTAKQRMQKQTKKRTQQAVQHQQRHPDVVAAGFSSPYKLLKGLCSELWLGLRAHSSTAGAAAAAAQGYFDYLPGSSIADDLHHYLHVS